MTTAPPSGPRSKRKSSLLLAILKYIGSYLLGIIMGIAFTPAEISLAGAPVWLFYPLAFLGFIAYYLYLSPQYVFGVASSYWLVGTIGLIPMLFELAAWRTADRGLSVWRPLWFGLPIGFLGTLGVYYSLAASI